jgi:hypothetical protein
MFSAFLQMAYKEEADKQGPTISNLFEIGRADVKLRGKTIAKSILIMRKILKDSVKSLLGKTYLFTFFWTAFVRKNFLSDKYLANC